MSEDRPKPLRVPVDAVPRRSAISWRPPPDEEVDPTPFASDSTRVERTTLLDEKFDAEVTLPRTGTDTSNGAKRERSKTIVEHQRPAWLDESPHPASEYPVDVSLDSMAPGAGGSKPPSTRPQASVPPPTPSAPPAAVSAAPVSAAPVSVPPKTMPSAPPAPSLPPSIPASIPPSMPPADELPGEATVLSSPPKAPTPRPTGAPEPEVEELEPLPPEETSPSVEVKLDAIAPKSAPPAEERVADAAAPSEASAKKPKKSSAVVIRGMVRVSEFPNQGSQPPAARAEFDGERTPFDGPPAEAIPLARVDAAVTPGVNDVPKAPRLPDAETLVNAAPFDEPSVEIELDAEDEVDDASGGEEEVVELDATLEMPRPSSPPPPPSAPRVEPPAAPAAPAPAVPAPAVPAAPAEQPRRKAWFETFFNDDSLRTVQPPVPKHVERECDFIERALDLAPGATILDVACGLGLHAMELNRRGYTVAAIDLSESMLSRARDEAKDLGLKVQFLHGDMQEMVFDIQFDAVVCWGTSFGYFDDDKNRQVIQRLHAALKPRGVLLLDVVNRDHVIQQQPNLVWFEGDGCVCMEESKFNYFHSRLQVKRTVILDDGRQRENGYSLRLYSAHELGKLLHTAGFRVTEFSGRIATPGVYFGAASPRMMIGAERRANATKTMPEVPSAEGPKSSPTNPALADTGEVTPPPAPPSSPAHPALADTGEVTPPPAPPSSPAQPALADTGEVTPPPAPPSAPPTTEE